MRLALTAIYLKTPEGYVATVAELSGVNTQGATLDEARRNLREAVMLIVEANRASVEGWVSGAEVVREPLTLSWDP
jgi:predicted RNase H-like HicB family nuclease